MPPLPPVPNVLKFEIQGLSSATQPFIWANVLHWAWSGTAPTAAGCATLAAQIVTQWTSHMAPECPSTTLLTSATVTDLSSNTAASGEDLVSVAGTRGDDEIPASAAVLIHYPVQVRYRGGHPRSYVMAGGNADFADASHWTTAFANECLSHWQSCWGAFNAGLVGGISLGSQVAVSYYDRQLNPTPPYRRTTPLVYAINVFGSTVDTQIASQRRRIGRRRK